MKKTDIATTTSGFLKLHDFNMSTAMAEELDGLNINFERIKIPSGGSTLFELPGEDSDQAEMTKEFSGVILWHHPLFALYTDKYTGANNPPVCGSFDGVTGEGIPGGSCKSCAYNQFGSGDNGAKACKNRRRIYILREGEIFPLLLSLPTGSLKEFTRYIKRLLGKSKKSNAVVTRFTLKKAISAGGIAYSQAQFNIERDLTAEEYALISAMTEQVKAHSKRVAFEVDEPTDNIPTIDPETGEII